MNCMLNQLVDLKMITYIKRTAVSNYRCVKILRAFLSRVENDLDTDGKVN